MLLTKKFQLRTLDYFITKNKRPGGFPNGLVTAMPLGLGPDWISASMAGQQHLRTTVHVDHLEAERVTPRAMPLAYHSKESTLLGIKCAA